MRFEKLGTAYYKVVFQRDDDSIRKVGRRYALRGNIRRHFAYAGELCIHEHPDRVELFVRYYVMEAAKNFETLMTGVKFMGYRAFETSEVKRCA